MLRLANPSDFFREVSQSASLKFKLAWLMFGGLVVPCSILVSIGMPEKYAVYLVLAGMIPFEYAAYCISSPHLEREPAAHRNYGVGYRAEA